MKQCENIFVFIDLTKSIGSDLGGQMRDLQFIKKINL